MSKDSDAFEKQAARIHELLEGYNATVTWNEKIPDPDNTSQPRQIDFTIRNPNSFIIGECRFRNAREDVQWIEELIGRKLSLKADGVIAVSSSGFTQGAKLKATAHGIALRKFSEITEKELESWGKKSVIQMIFAKLTDLVFEYPLHKENAGPYIFANETGQPMQLLGFFQGITHKVDDLKPKNKPTTFMFDMVPENIYVGGEKITRLKVRGRMEKYQEPVDVLSIHCYAEPSSKDSSAYVQRLDLAQSEIIAHENDVGMIIDCSNMVLPPNTFFYGFSSDFGREVNLESLELLGLEQAFNGRVALQFDIRFYD